MILRYRSSDWDNAGVWFFRHSDAPPFKAGPIPASEYRGGVWRDASFPVFRRPALPFIYPYKRQRVPA